MRVRAIVRDPMLGVCVLGLRAPIYAILNLVGNELNEWGLSISILTHNLTNLQRRHIKFKMENLSKILKASRKM